MTRVLHRVLLLGAGRWGANHLRVLRHLPVELFLADTNAARLAPAREMGVPEDHLSTNPDAFLDRVDAAVVVTPAPSHFDLCSRLLKSGKDVFVEKPLTLRSKGSGELAQLAEAKGRILQVGHIFRFDPASQWLRKEIAAGRFGRLKILRGNFSGFKRPRNDTGVTFADAIHFVDLFLFFLGTAPLQVTAMMKDFFGRGMDDESFIAMEFGTKVAPGTADRRVRTWATVETGYHSPGKAREVTVIGDELSAVCDFNVAQYKIKTFRNTHHAEGKEIKAVEGEMHQLEFPPEEPLLAELRAFIESVETRQTPLADGWAGYDAVRVIEAAIESAQSGRTVELARSVRQE
ncbi:MAG: Gfo/Idh/MocA family oxidoreductase [Verrucomicrobiae bacterium]|nr:Gfo/Idh/MocA family oxidoreductase [Verrucomicrobiae bacterium]